MVNLFDFSKNQSTVPNATGYLSKFTPKPAPVLNFGAPMSGTTQFSESGIKQAPKPTAPTSGGFSLVPKANAGELDQAKIERFIQRGKDLGKSRDEIKMAYDKALQQGLFNVGGQQPIQAQDINDLSLGQELIQRGKNLGQDFTRRAGEVSQSFTRQTSDNPLISSAQPLGTALKTAGSVVGAGFDVLGEGIAFITPDVVKEGLSDAGKAIWDNTPEVVKQTAITAIKEGGEAYRDFKQNNPFLADALEGSGNIAGILPVGYGAKATGKGVVKGAEKIVDTTNTLGKSIEAKGENFRNAIAGLDEKEVMALKNTPREEWEGIINQARLAKDNDYLQTPYNEGAKKANDAFKQLEQNLETSQKARVETLKNSGIEKIETGKVRQDIVKDIEDTFNIQGVNIVDGKIKYKTTPGRESLLREENIKDYEALKLLENATKSRTPLQMMDNIKKMQSLIYESTDGLRVSKDMGNLIKRSIGKLNQSFKEQVGGNYASILDDMAQDIRIKNELVKIFKASSGEEALNRGELAMKRLANGTTTSAEARQLALLVKERTGIDLIKEARLRQLAMDLVDDTRGATLFGSIERGPKGILDYSLEKAKKLTPFDKEKTALARTLKPKKLKNGNNTNSSNTTSNTSNKQANTNSNTNNTPLISKSNNTPLKSTAITTQATQKEVKPLIKSPLSERERKLLKAPTKTQLETTLKGATTSNIDEVTQSVAKTLKTTKTAEIKAIIQRYLKEFGKDFKNKIGDLIEEISEKIGAKLNLISDKQGIGVEKTALLKGSDDLIEEANDIITLPVKENKFLTNFAKGKTFDEFISSIRGSSTQYGQYEPRLRTFLRPGAKRLGDLLPNDRRKFITVYRGIDKSENPRIKTQIRSGDFVTTSYDDALGYADSPLNVASIDVPLSKLITEYPEDFLKNNKGKSYDKIEDYELIYKPVIEDFYGITDKQLKQIYEQAQKSKPLKKAEPKGSDDLISEAKLIKDYKKHWGFWDNNTKAIKKELIENAKNKYNLLPEEATAVNIYTKSEYHNFNDFLRQGLKREDYNVFKNMINNALDKMPNYKGKTYREGRLPNNILENINIGDEIFDKAPMSTSYDKNALRVHRKINTKDETRVFYEIDSKSGKIIEDLSDFKNEKEVLFKPNTKFIVENIKKETDDLGDKIYLTIKEL